MTYPSRLRKIAVATASTVLAALLLPTAAATAASAAPTQAAASTPSAAASPTLTTWMHEKTAEATGPIADDEVRRSPFYDVTVAPDATAQAAQESFVYLSVPRSGEGKIGYDEQDGAEFSADAELTMSWSSFAYAEDVWVDVHLATGQTISSVDEVTIRPTDLALEKVLVDPSTVRVKIPYTGESLRLSVEFDPQLYTAYNDRSGESGVLTTVAEGNLPVHTEPQNALLIFANPQLSEADTDRYVPSEADGTIYRPEPGLVNNLNDTDAEIVYFEPGTYYMGSDYHALLPEQVRWVYLAPGAYVKGAFRFLHETQDAFTVSGLGVLSGEQYVYEPDTTAGYQHSVEDNCHSTCVKMLQFESNNQGQTLDLQGITINQPPYHSFVVYAHVDGTEVQVENFRMDVRDYKQVGSWYWQTDGIELYADSVMKSTFFHANDDVLKMYHSNVTIDDTVIWKGENGPVVQWGWGPREVHDVQVSGTDIIHNRMYWKDVKYNTCVFNSSTHWEDMGATDRADPTQTVRDMTFTDTRVEGAVNCGIRIFAMASTENITIDGFSVDEWNGLEVGSQASLLRRMHNPAGEMVTIGNEMTDGKGILLHNYTVGGESILKAGDNWAAREPGRLNFDADTWDNWNATADDEPTGPAPTLEVTGLEDGSTAASREITVEGTTDAASLAVAVNGQRTEATVTDGAFSVPVTLPAITNYVVVTATGENGVKTVIRRAVTALGTELGAVSDPVGDDNGPGTYTYPTDGAFNAGSFDLTGLRVYRDGDTVRFVTTTAGEIRNPWGGDGMSTQRLNIYLQQQAAPVARALAAATTELLPGTNTSVDTPWTHAIVADGRYGSAVLDPAGEPVGEVDLEVDPAGAIIVSVPAEVFGDIDLATVGYQVSMFSAAEGGEGLGNVRPIYSTECATTELCPDFVGPYRGAGGAGEFTDAEDSRDTDTRDSNAFDIISGELSQAEVMDFTRGPVVVPYVQLVAAVQPGEPGEEPGQPGEPGEEPGQPGTTPGTDAAPVAPDTDTDTDDALAATGGDAGWILLLLGGAVAAGSAGILLLVRARRRDA